VSPEALEASAESRDGSTLDDFDALCRHLSDLHPSRYGRLLDGVSMVHLRGVHPAEDQNVGLRLVAFADRLYDSAIPVLVSGEPLPTLFTEEMVNGGYRKKYLRAISRLTALARDATAK
jgi:cell division protein ZapE